MRTYVYKISQIVLILLIICTVAHAFYQSALPAKQSAEQSDKVGEIIEEIIPPDTKPGEYVQKNLRKLAHFTEFFFLGLWSALYTVVFYRKKLSFFALMPFGMTIALLDETVQIFSKRGSSVKDVWIDILGYTSALFLVLSAFLVFLLVRYMRNRKNPTDNLS